MLAKADASESPREAEQETGAIHAKYCGIQKRGQYRTSEQR